MDEGPRASSRRPAPIDVNSVGSLTIRPSLVKRAGPRHGMKTRWNPTAFQGVEALRAAGERTPGKSVVARGAPERVVPPSEVATVSPTSSRRDARCAPSGVAGCSPQRQAGWRPDRGHGRTCDPDRRGMYRRCLEGHRREGPGSAGGCRRLARSSRTLAPMPMRNAGQRSLVLRMGPTLRPSLGESTNFACFGEPRSGSSTKQLPNARPPGSSIHHHRGRNVVNRGSPSEAGAVPTPRSPRRYRSTPAVSTALASRRCSSLGIELFSRIPLEIPRSSSARLAMAAQASSGSSPSAPRQRPPA